MICRNVPRFIAGLAVVWGSALVGCADHTPTGLASGRSNAPTALRPSLRTVAPAAHNQLTLNLNGDVYVLDTAARLLQSPTGIVAVEDEFIAGLVQAFRGIPAADDFLARMAAAPPPPPPLRENCDPRTDPFGCREQDQSVRPGVGASLEPFLGYTPARSRPGGARSYDLGALQVGVLGSGFGMLASEPRFDGMLSGDDGNYSCRDVAATILHETGHYRVAKTAYYASLGYLTTRAYGVAKPIIKRFQDLKAGDPLPTFGELRELADAGGRAATTYYNGVAVAAYLTAFANLRAKEAQLDFLAGYYAIKGCWTSGWGSPRGGGGGGGDDGGGSGGEWVATVECTTTDHYNRERQYTHTTRSCRIIGWQQQ